MKKILVTLLIFSAIGLSVIAFAGRGGSSNGNSNGRNRGPDVDRSSAIVQLRGDPISTSRNTKPAHGRKIDFKSNAVRSYRAQLNAQRNQFRQWLHANAPRARITSEYDVSLNAVAVQLNGTSLATIAAAPMVESAEYNTLYYPNLSQSYKIINATGAWNAAGGRATAITGMTIPIPLRIPDKDVVSHVVYLNTLKSTKLADILSIRSGFLIELFFVSYTFCPMK